tara:strand:+ start:24589 stop:24969 length:381 start_codon:yes stop_codon:yes gene_type:complete
MKHTVIKAKELKPGDTIIHDYSVFKINECGCGIGAGNEFGEYFWMKGEYPNRAKPLFPLEKVEVEKDFPFFIALINPLYVFITWFFGIKYREDKRRAEAKREAKRLMKKSTEPWASQECPVIRIDK